MANIFDQIVGHQRQVEYLQRLIREGAAAGTYLFCGPQHVGKDSVAFAFAKALLCVGAGRMGCLECEACRKVDAAAHPDLIVLSPQGASQTIKFEKTDELRHRAQMSSFYGGWRVGIIQDAHTLHYQSAPSLLKILEEPPSQSAFILVSHREDQILPTLRSRCKIVPFFPLPEKLLATRLKKEFGEGAGSEEAVQSVLKVSGGCLGMALRMTHGDFIPKRDKILTLLENLVFGRFSSVVAAVEELLALAKPPASAASEEDETQKFHRREEREALLVLQTLLRDLWLTRLAGPAFLLHGDRADRLAALAEKWRDVDLDRALTRMEDASRDLEFNVSLRLILERLFLGMHRAEAVAGSAL